MSLSVRYAPKWISSPSFKEPVPITKGPEGHWFGYYDKWQRGSHRPICFGGGSVGFEGRSPSGTE